MTTITCHCSAIVEIDVPDPVDIDKNPLIFKQLQEGSFLTSICTQCGATLRPELKIRLISGSRGLEVLVVPEMDRLAVYREKISAPKESEILVGYAELFERARILRDGLEAKTVEIIKYFLLSKAEEQEPEADIVVLYHGLVKEKLEFHILGMKSGETGILQLPRDRADKSASDLAIEDPKFKELFAGQYRSIRKLEFLAEDEQD